MWPPLSPTTPLRTWKCQDALNTPVITEKTCSHCHTDLQPQWSAWRIKICINAANVALDLCPKAKGFFPMKRTFSSSSAERSNALALQGTCPSPETNREQGMMHTGQLRRELLQP